MRYTYTKKLFTIYLKFKFNWVPYILSGNPTTGLSLKKSTVTSRHSKAEYNMNAYLSTGLDYLSHCYLITVGKLYCVG